MAGIGGGARGELGHLNNVVEQYGNDEQRRSAAKFAGDAAVAALLLLMFLHLLPSHLPAPKKQVQDSQATAAHSPQLAASASQPRSSPSGTGQ